MTTPHYCLGSQNLSDKIYGEIDTSGGFWKVKQDGASSLITGARRDAPEGSAVKFTVCFSTFADASTFLAYCYSKSPAHPDFDEVDGANIALYFRSSDWYYSVWGVVVKPVSLNKTCMDYLQYAYEVICYLYSPYSLGAAQDWDVTNQALPETATINNSTGHIASSYESLIVTCAYAGSAHVADLALSYGGASLTICDDALTNEIWELKGNENRLLETYEDTITAGTQWAQDWTGDGTFDTDHIELDDGEAAYLKLSGPNPTRYPVVMTADLSLDSGGTSAEVQISSDSTSWETVLDQDDFESGSAEYVLPGTEFITDIYIRLVCDSGTAGKYLNIGSIKFEVERWIEAGAPTVAAAANPITATLSGTGTVTIDGTFRPRQMFL